ncbi:cytochrome bo(3) ubiquinol oxidase subunit 4 [Variibacter gotjawalensis]|uniref:Cytochrome bo(3) ubiquinol oxidase subunit 4 n=1 Tax=Variibacter gotjawalensis TaxID=1333996 RepID=A0A0S3Q0F3_9BRAD|nr:cytochrome o ubiquinol oxidase subunit IV [Variibacter gotjawalensis]NIK47455.1 cytochrome o ubiquinol oxidase operon protein cyoD [Variibacter gotjawalensis]RZS49350.1 cytochrome bb3 quinol oxidase subunit 4 [Variibacter gotjawalensis]BAT61614.1 cytochrome bo(3) ubiquinol oxidase subunit 4 [Variibacter gotjawalensis]
MSESDARHTQDEPPGKPEATGSVSTYLIGLGFAVILTLASFWVAQTSTVWAPGVPILLAVLAIGQMGVHLVFFLHISSAPEDLNNVLALAFGVFVVGLIVFGSMIIVNNLNTNMMPTDKLIQMQR